jgi:hypothetical protein
LERAWGELVDAVEEVLHLQRPWRWPVPADERRGWSGWCTVLRGLTGAISSGGQLGGHEEGVGWAGAGERRCRGAALGRLEEGSGWIE